MEDILRECKTHGITTYKWYRHSGTKKGYCYGCKACRLQWTQERQNHHRKVIIEYKGSCCTVCGYDKCQAALEFHHTYSSDKLFTLSKPNMSMSLLKLKLEADKCVLLCANCHREHHNMT